MSNVCTKIIDSNDKIDGRAVIYTTLGGTYQYLERDVIVKSLPIDEINSRLSSRMDNPQYYTA